MRTLYIDPLSLLIWMNRAVYIGIFASSVWLHDKFFGEFNLLYPVSPLLAYVSMLGLLSFEFGILFGRLRWRKPLKNKVRDVNRLKPATLAVPMILWGISIAASVILFYIKGVPVLTDPMLRATMGANTGILKRFMMVLLPISCLEVFALAVAKRCPRWLSGMVILGTLIILYLLTFKGKIFFLVLFIVLIYYKMQVFRKHLSFRFHRLNVKYVVLSGLVVLFIGAIIVYPIVTPSDYNFITEMTVRMTNSIAQSPNYIISGYRDVPSRNELLLNEVAGIARTFRIPFSVEPKSLDTVMTRAILNRDIEFGGLNPTVIGYGWIIGKWAGVICLSLLYGIVSIKLLGAFLQTSDPCKIACCIFTMYLVFCAVQIFSPVRTFLGSGLGLLAYIVCHRLLVRLFHFMAMSIR